MVSWRGSGRGRCVTSEEVRLDRPASETSRLWQAPCLTWCVALLDRGGPLRGGGGGRGAGTVAVDRSTCTPRYGVGWGCAVGAARQVEAVSDGGEGVRGRSGRAGAGLVASSGGIGAVGRRRGCVGR